MGDSLGLQWARQNGSMPTPAGRKRGRPRTRLVSLSELAEYLSVSRNTIYSLLEEGLPSVRVGEYSRLYKPVVVKWLRERTARRKAEGWE